MAIKLPRKTSRKVSQMTRRRLMKALSASSFTAVSAIHLTTDDVAGAASDEKPIVIGFDSSEVDESQGSLNPVVKYVPRDWHDELVRARRANKKLANAYGSRSGVISQSVIPGVIGGNSARVQVGVSREHASELRGIIPEVLEDTPVDIVEVTPPTPDSCSACYNSGDYYLTIPGGVRAVGGGSGGGCGALSSRLYDSDGNHKFTTAHHVFEGKDVTGDSLYHPSKSVPKIGDVDDSLCGDDVVVVEPANSHTPERRVESGVNEDINGQFTMDGVADLKSNDVDVHCVGCTTGKTDGQIHSANTTFWAGYGCIPRHGQVTWGTGDDSMGGDSGALVAAENPNDSNYDWAVSMDQWSTDKVGGVGAYRLKNEHEYHF